MEQFTYDDVINRIGFFRTRANLSLRETSLRLGFNPQFMKTIENKSVELKMRTFLNFCELVDITPQDFFYLGTNYNKEDKNLLELFGTLSPENKHLVIDLIKKLK